MADLFNIDLETFSECDLKACGSYNYAKHPSTEIMLAGFAPAIGDVQVHDYTKNRLLRDDLARLCAVHTGYFVGHNGGQFERLVLKHVFRIDIPVKRWIDTAVLCRAVGMPGSLEAAGHAFGLPEDLAKIKDGKRLINKFCKPAPRNHKVDRYTHENAPEDWQRFIDYLINDVIAMREIHKLIPNLPNHFEHERPIWELDQKINDRGFYIDLDLVHAAIKIIDSEKMALNQELSEITDGQVTSAAQVAKLRDYVNSNSRLNLKSLDKSTLNRIKTEGLPADIQRIIEIRQQVSQSSLAKYAKLVLAVNSDSRIHGSLLYAGASRTGRWSGRLFQPQNLPRPEMKNDQILEAIEVFKQHGAA